MLLLLTAGAREPTSPLLHSAPVPSSSRPERTARPPPHPTALRSPPPPDRGARRGLLTTPRLSVPLLLRTGAQRRRDDSATSPSRGRAPAPVPSCVAARPWPVLHELRVENLLLIERAELRLA